MSTLISQPNVPWAYTFGAFEKTRRKDDEENNMYLSVYLGHHDL